MNIFHILNRKLILNIFLILFLFMLNSNCKETLESEDEILSNKIKEIQEQEKKGLPWFLDIHEMIENVLDFFDMKKNKLASFSMEGASSIIDQMCSSFLFMSYVPQKFSPDIKKMSFQLITSTKNYSIPLLESEKLWNHMEFNAKKKIVILATGWTNTVNESDTINMMWHAFLERKDTNFIVVDAAFYVDTLYKWAALNTEEIGEHIAIGLHKLIKIAPMEKIHLIGHSLGAHIMGSAGRVFSKLSGKLIPRITGLDPAKPCFYKNATLHNLQRGDAEIVDVIHSNSGILGKKIPIGDLDFYPGGANPLPPGCITVGCAHSRAVEYFTESIYPGNEYNFMASKCPTWKSLQDLDCVEGTISPMGYVINTKAKGIFYLDVNRKKPYGKSKKMQWLQKF